MSAPRRPPRRNVDGVLLLDKPSGISSNGALGRVKRLYNPAKAGHTGTLDPLASGLLPICLGAATRFAQFLLDAHKRYTATVRFGITTTTQDADGDIVLSRAVAIDRAGARRRPVESGRPANAVATGALGAEVRRQAVLSLRAAGDRNTACRA
jgi:tRNA pseudouridine55 synthase